ncbi:MAG: hypothetical protein QOG15_285 [Solirubrobacteraceae bacterium]|jgi:hypothetical protein|nr:hypothetical protein [Solirubrobacteraceae bacterium]
MRQVFGRGLAAAVIVVVVSFGLVACGGSDKKSGDTLSKSELATKATTICKAATEKGNKIQTPSNLADANAAAAYFTKLVDLTQKQTDDLKALNPADDIKTDWDAYIAQQQKATDLLKRTRDAAKSKDVSGLTNFQTEAPQIQKDTDAAGAKVGVNC